MGVDIIPAFENNPTFTIKWSEVHPNYWDTTHYMPELNAENGTPKMNRAAIQKADIELLTKKDSTIREKTFYVKWSEVTKRLDISCFEE